MLISAIRDDNPVIFIEHRWLYDVTGEVDENNDPATLEGCQVSGAKVFCQAPVGVVQFELPGWTSAAGTGVW